MARRTVSAGWKILAADKLIWDALSDEALGKALKLAGEYFYGNEVDESSLDTMTQIAYKVFKRDIDLTRETNRKKSEGGSKSAAMRASTKQAS